MDSDGKAYSVSYEWSGLIGDTYSRMVTYPWQPLVPILFLGLTILSAQMMLNGFKEVMNNKPLYVKGGANPRNYLVKKNKSNIHG